MTDRDAPRDVDHATTEQHGGSDQLVTIRRRKQHDRAADRRLTLELVDNAGDADVVLRAGVPRTRAECPRERPCCYVTCKFHLAYQAGIDRSGRRHDGRHPPSTLRFVEGPSCTLDVVDAHPDGMALSDIGDVLGLTPRAVQLVAAKALRKLGLNEDQIAELLEDPVEGDRRIDYAMESTSRSPWVTRTC